METERKKTGAGMRMVLGLMFKHYAWFLLLVLLGVLGFAASTVYGSRFFRDFGGCLHHSSGGE